MTKQAIMRPYSDRDRAPLEHLLHRSGWEPRYVAGQIDALDTFSREAERGLAIVAVRADDPVAYISAEFHAWNSLGQIHGLVVDERYRREGLAGRLVWRVERAMEHLGARGVYVDTPFTNVGARAFYESQGYTLDYRMTEYYGVGVDGVTYLKLFE